MYDKIRLTIFKKCQISFYNTSSGQRFESRLLDHMKLYAIQFQHVFQQEYELSTQSDRNNENGVSFKKELEKTYIQCMPNNYTVNVPCVLQPIA